MVEKESNWLDYRSSNATVQLVVSFKCTGIRRRYEEEI